MTANRVIGVDLGGTKVLAGVIDEQGRVHETVERPTVTTSQTALLDELASLVAELPQANVAAVAGTGCRILHTRKTAPGLRALDIAAVLAGGGVRHREDLGHELMVKDNRLLEQAQRESNLSLPATNVVRNLFDRLMPKHAKAGTQALFLAVQDAAEQ